MQGVLSSILRTVLRTENPHFKSEGFPFALFGLHVIYIAPALGWVLKRPPTLNKIDAPVRVVVTFLI